MAAIGTPVEQASDLRLDCSVKASWRTHRLHPALLFLLQWKEFRRVKRGSYSGRRPSFSGANPQGVESAAQTPLMPANLSRGRVWGLYGWDLAAAVRMRRRKGDKQENTLDWGWGWADVRRAMIRIMEISGSERGVNRSRGCYSTATNPGNDKTMKRLPSKVQEDS